MEAHDFWDELVRRDGAINAATASPSTDPFVRYPSWVESHIEDGWTILDGGCGYGRVAISLLRARAKAHLIGVDASAEMLAEFRRYGADIMDRVHLMHSDLRSIDLPSNSVDAVVTCAVLLHQSYRDARAIIGEFARILRPGGTLIAADSFPNTLNLEGVQNYVRCAWAGQDNGPVRPYTRGQVRRLLTGFSKFEISCVGTTILPRRVGWWHPAPALARRVNALAGSLPLGRAFASRHNVVAVK